MFRIEDRTIYITKGDTALILFKVQDYILKPGDTVKFTVKKNITSSLISIQKVITQFTEEGNVRIQLSDSDTDLIPGKYYYDIQLNLIDGRVDTVITPSIFMVEKGVTD